MRTSIWWIRRDLRLADNQALDRACTESDQVIPVFILDDKLMQSSYVGPKRLAFLFGGLRELDEKLRQRGSYLVVRHGTPLLELSSLIEESGSDKVYAEMDYSPYAQERDRVLSKNLDILWAAGPVFHPPGSVLKPDGNPYTVFTPFLKAWKTIPSPVNRFLPATDGQIRTPPGINTLPIPYADGQDSLFFLPGENEAQSRLRKFVFDELDDGIGQSKQAADNLSPIYRYAQMRDQLAFEGTSSLSPYLRFGMISINQVISAANEAIEQAPTSLARQSAMVWLSELVWREFYVHILYHFPQVRNQNFRLKEIEWENDPINFRAWCKGETGYPIVDAAMRQLEHTGWMHNRARMVTASFLTKDLLVDWRWGEKYFMQCLVDGDPASNNGGWQWTAGTGTDAAPYFRIFNPISQSRKYDPEGIYIRRWLPVLRSVPNEYIHTPNVMPKEIQEKVGCRIGEEYPEPIVDHNVARQRALQVYRRLKPS